jgi:hypothetical protein
MLFKHLPHIVASSLLLALSASSATAQSTGPDVVVTAEKEQATREAREVKHFVTAIAAPSEGQFARFRAPICPVAIGMSDDYAEEIVARVREIAAKIGAEVGKARCTANVLIILSPDGQAFVRDAQKSQPSLLSGLSDTELRALLAARGPVHAWSGTEIRNEDGLQAHDSASKGAGGADTMVFPDHPIMRVMSASIINQPVRRDIMTAVVIFDISAVTGKSLTQIADYAAMRALGRTRAAADGLPYETILSLFGAGDAAKVPAISPADLAFLSALYRTSGLQTAAGAAGQVTRGMLRRGRVERDQGK